MPRRRVARLRSPQVSGPGAPPPQPFTPAALPGLVAWLHPAAQGSLQGDPSGSYTGALDNTAAIDAALGASEALLMQWVGSAGTVNFQAPGGNTTPVNISAPVISGSAVEGQLLSVSDGSWSGSPPPTFTYQWRRQPSGGSFSNISGATASNYSLVSADVGAMINCIVTATNTAGSASATSGSVGPVAASSTIILTGIAGAVAEWDSANSAVIGNPVTEWRDLIGSNHAVTDLGTSGPGLTTFGGRQALSFDTDHMRCGSIIMPQPTEGGATLSVVVVPNTIPSGQVAIGEGCSTNSVGGASIFLQASGVVRAYLGNGSSRQNTGPTPSTPWATNTPIVLQMTYTATALKLKINNDAPVSVSHSFTTIQHRNLGLGAVGAGSAGSALNGLIMWAGYCTGAKSDADLSTIATRLMARFFP